MSAALNKELKTKYNVRCVPIRQDDEVEIVRGRHSGKSGKVTAVPRRKYCIHVDRVTCDKANGQQIQLPIHTSNVVIVKLKLDKDRKALLKRRNKSAQKGKYTEADVDN